MVNLHFLAKVLWDKTFDSVGDITKLESKWKNYVLDKERTSHKETAHIIEESDIIYEKQCASARPAFVISAVNEEKKELMHLYWCMGLHRQHESQATLFIAFTYSAWLLKLIVHKDSKI